jgi:hypothetical protein
LECPANYAYGGQEVYGQFDSFRIPEDTDLSYDLSVLNCEPNIDALNKKNTSKNNGAIKLTKEKKVNKKSIIGSGEPIPDDKDRDNSGNHAVRMKDAVKKIADSKKKVAKIVEADKKEKEKEDATLKDAEKEVKKLKSSLRKQKAKIDKEKKDLEKDNEKAIKKGKPIDAEKMIKKQEKLMEK